MAEDAIQLTEAQLEEVEAKVQTWAFAPDKPVPWAMDCCYRVRGNGEILYIGVAEILEDRWTGDKVMQLHMLHAQGAEVELDYVEVGNTDNAFALERAWLHKYKPAANREMRGNANTHWRHDKFTNKQDPERLESKPYRPPVHPLPEIDLTPTPEAVAAAKAEVERRRAAITKRTVSVGWHTQGEQVTPKENRGVLVWGGIALLIAGLAVLRTLAEM